ncbi:MAG: response regulator transcription factor [Chloroflexi bacterium]|nr:response regulator transcription factor [Chloroflexota bacterium]MBU1751762.1 response regulator transcription factor [Chloroflexota bacterium]MBU1877547.1 response regulator transcription factor [Chloroflexota bacterium]
MSSPPLKVLLVEDDWSVRSAVRDYLVRRSAAVCEADNQETALAVAQAERPDVAVVDIVLPQRPGERADFDQHIGIATARQLRELLPDLGIVFLSAYVDRGPEVVQLYMDGHDRIVYLLKGSKPQELWTAIHKVAGGLTALELAASVQRHKTAFDQALETLTPGERAHVQTALRQLLTLSEPELRVFEVVGACHTRHQAAQELDLSPKTVDSHMDAVYDKLLLRQIGPGLNPLMLLAKVCLLHRLQESNPR